jgi:hypothetical protein
MSSNEIPSHPIENESNPRTALSDNDGTNIALANAIPYLSNRLQLELMSPLLRSRFQPTEARGGAWDGSTWRDQRINSTSSAAQHDLPSYTGIVSTNDTSALQQVYQMFLASQIAPGQKSSGSEFTDETELQQLRMIVQLQQQEQHEQQLRLQRQLMGLPQVNDDQQQQTLMDDSQTAASSLVHTLLQARGVLPLHLENELSSSINTSLFHPSTTGSINVTQNPLEHYVTEYSTDSTSMPSSARSSVTNSSRLLDSYIVPETDLLFQQPKDAMNWYDFKAAAEANRLKRSDADHRMPYYIPIQVTSELLHDLGSERIKFDDPYVDVSAVAVDFHVNDTILQTRLLQTSNGGVTHPFPTKLHELLTDADKDHVRHEIVSFLPHGRAFHIHQPTAFEKHLLPAYFTGQKDLGSFCRQLNLYGFVRVKLSPDDLHTEIPMTKRSTQSSGSQDSNILLSLLERYLPSIPCSN